MNFFKATLHAKPKSRQESKAMHEDTLMMFPWLWLKMDKCFGYCLQCNIIITIRQPRISTCLLFRQINGMFG
jgi:hypothetical protein